MDRFAGKAVLVTGAGSGIGQASALRLGQEGGQVFCVDISADSVEATADQIRSAGGTAETHICDISDEEAVADCVSACVERFGGLYALINMAGILRFDDTASIRTEDWNRVVAINLTGTMLLCRQALPHLIESGGNIVNAASTAALAGLPSGTIYSATKGGVLAMTRSIAVEYAKRGVRANCVSPGDIKSNMTRGIDFPDNFDFDLMPRISSMTGEKPPAVVAGV
ncbi:MAG: SDR family NAD(P)-dependent oxidoreductase, partial [Pseudomonadota bacterium]